jgi:U3 small nucleolar RNA-associated protein 7
MRYQTAQPTKNFDFCPFEDVLGIGSKSGFTSIIVPGAGEPNPDTWQYNPYQTKKQRAETEVRMLLEKCPPETIALDPNLLGKLDSDKIAGKII